MAAAPVATGVVSNVSRVAQGPLQNAVARRPAPNLVAMRSQPDSGVTSV
jgi:hypothetical protein